MFQKRLYRSRVKNHEFKKIELKFFESNLLLCSEKNIKKRAEKELRFFHEQIRKYIEKNREFETALTPLGDDKSAPPIIRQMIRASRKAGVGPMATVAGAIAQFLGRRLLGVTDQIIVENGGDIYISVNSDTKVGVFAGIGNIYNNLAIELKAAETPCGICTSSGRFGHSLSFGSTYATIVLSRSALIADAFSTAIGNLVHTEHNIPAALKIAKNNRLIRGLLIITENKLTCYGKIKLGVLDKEI